MWCKNHFSTHRDWSHSSQCQHATWYIEIYAYLVIIKYVLNRQAWKVFYNKQLDVNSTTSAWFQENDDLQTFLYMIQKMCSVLKGIILKIEKPLFYQKTPSLTARKKAHHSFIFCSSIWASFNIIVITNLLVQYDGKVSGFVNEAGISCQCNARLTTRRKILVLVSTVKVRWKRRNNQ